MNYIIITFLVALSAMFSGLTLGYFSLNRAYLERKAKLGDPNAIKAYNIRKRGNLLLCTLLIGNVATNATLSIYLGSLISGVLAGFIATGLIVLLGEILPQAVFSRHALRVGANFSWLARIFLFVFFPVCYPISYLLDRFLGKELPTVYSKRELIKLIEEHEDNQESEIDADEERIIKGALSFSDKEVSDIMTPRVSMYMLSVDQKLDVEAIRNISAAGRSRIPVFGKTRDEIVGVLYVKDLLKEGWQNKTAGEVARHDVIFVDADKKLDTLLNDFKKTRQHLFIVVSKYGDVLGLVTIEDVVEEIIGEEIVDEFDKHENMQEAAKNDFIAKKVRIV